MFLSRSMAVAFSYGRRHSETEGRSSKTGAKVVVRLGLCTTSFTPVLAYHRERYTSS